MSKKYTNKEIDKLFKKFNVIRLSNYEGIHKKIKVKYLKCGCINENNTPSNILQGYGCSIHSNIGRVKKYTNEEVDDLLKPFNIKRLSNYINYKTPFVVKYLICGCINENATLKSIMQGCGCSTHNNTNYNPNREEVEENTILYRKIKTSCYNIKKYLELDKDDHILNELGYTIEAFKNHLNTFPEYKILKETNWHLDHVVPKKVCFELGIKDIKIINSLDNLQPLSAEDNINKGSKFNKQDVLKLLKKFNISINESIIDNLLLELGEYKKDRTNI